MALLALIASTVNYLFASLYPEIHLSAVTTFHMLVSRLKCSRYHELGHEALPERVKYVESAKDLFAPSLISFGAEVTSMEPVAATGMTVCTSQGFPKPTENSS